MESKITDFRGFGMYDTNVTLSISKNRMNIVAGFLFLLMISGHGKSRLFFRTIPIGNSFSSNNCSFKLRCLNKIVSSYTTIRIFPKIN